MAEDVLIWFLGDVHGQFDHLPGLVAGAAVKPAALVFLGDLDCPAPYAECVAGIESQGVTTWFIPGNHDTDSEACATNLLDSDLACARNLHGRVVLIDGKRIAGLGGVFRQEIWHPGWKGGTIFHASFQAYAAYLNGIRPERLRHGGGQEMAGIIRQSRLRRSLSSIFHDDWERLSKESADILVTHEAPDCHRNGFAAINDLAYMLGASLLFHGHHHECPDYRQHDDRLGFRAYGVGYRGILDQEGRIIRPGEFDEPRHRRSVAASPGQEEEAT